MHHRNVVKNDYRANNKCWVRSERRQLLGGVQRIFELLQPPYYVFLVELAWCFPSRHVRDLTVSLTQMAKIKEIKIVPMKILLYLTLTEFDL